MKKNEIIETELNEKGVDIFDWIKKIDEKIEEIERKIENLDYVK